MENFSANPALIIVDVQKGFDDAYWGLRNNPGAEKQIVKLLDAWRRTKRPVFHVQHMSTDSKSPLYPGREGNDFKDIVRPLAGEPVIRKSVNSAFIGTDLEQRLRRDNITTLVIVGLTTNHCISTTTRMAGNLGFQTFVVSDATATFGLKGPDGKNYAAEELHALGLAELHGEFATVVDTEFLLSRILATVKETV